MYIRCGQCAAGFHVDDIHRGKQTKCPKCANPITVEPVAESAKLSGKMESTPDTAAPQIQFVPAEELPKKRLGHQLETGDPIPDDFALYQLIHWFERIGFQNCGKAYYWAGVYPVILFFTFLCWSIFEVIGLMRLQHTNDPALFLGRSLIILSRLPFWLALWILGRILSALAELMAAQCEAYRRKKITPDPKSLFEKLTHAALPADDS